MILVALALFWTVAALPSPARADEMYSVTWDIPLSCGGDWWGLLNNGHVGGPINATRQGRKPGAGVYPTASVYIVGYDVSIGPSSPPSYVMIGHTQPNGDAITPYVYGNPNSTTQREGFYPAGSYFMHDPAVDELHMHAACYGAPAVTVKYTMFYQCAAVGCNGRPGTPIAANP